MITRTGVPILWPVPFGRRMWTMVRLPSGLAIRAGGPVETIALRGAFLLIIALAGSGLVFAPVLRTLGI